jgi:predicted metalloprotease with PDZ domain
VQTLDGVASYDWASFINDKLESAPGGTVLDGVERGGYRLVYRKTPNAFDLDADQLFDVESLRYSLGLTVGSSGKVKEVLWESPAFDAGLTTGSQLIAVNGRAFTPDELKQAVISAETGAPVELLIKRGKHHAMTTIDYHGGLRFPHLEPIEGARRRLDEIYAQR